MANTMRWEIGKVTITKVVESSGSSPPHFMFRELTAERVQQHRWLRPHFATDEGRLIASVHCFIIESQGQRIAVDTCVGNDKPRLVKAWNMLQGSFLQDLAEAGHPAESVNTVLCTHLHVDHVGWNTRWTGERWVPTFPNARYLFGRTEYEHWSAVPEADDQQVMTDSVRPVVDAGLVTLVDSTHRVTDEVWLEPTPGHTPGHVAVRISSGGQEAVITGDLMHHPIQCCEPVLGSNFDSDAEQARKTRFEFLQRYGDTPVLVLGTHFAPPTAGWLRRSGEAWEFGAEAPAAAG
jgi:glyoxylase-like metal-dependent hydrolase (beta-lactamase superfamily II)